MRKNIWLSLFALCFIAGGVNVSNGLQAADYNPDSVLIKKCQDFKITGDGLSEPWKITEWINLAQQERNTSLYKTKVKSLYSQTGIYFL